MLPQAGAQATPARGGPGASRPRPRRPRASRGLPRARGPGCHRSSPVEGSRHSQRHSQRYSQRQPRWPRPGPHCRLRRGATGPASPAPSRRAGPGAGGPRRPRGRTLRRASRARGRLRVRGESRVRGLAFPPTRRALPRAAPRTTGPLRPLRGSRPRAPSRAAPSCPNRFPRRSPGRCRPRSARSPRSTDHGQRCGGRASRRSRGPPAFPLRTSSRLRGGWPGRR